MGCKKCGTKAAQPAFASASSLTYSFDLLYPMYGVNPTTHISAREDVSVVLPNNTIKLPAGQLVAVPSVIVDQLVEVGAPIWIF